ncbi:MAG: hypothetical protein PUC32_02295 [Oscillospiraceae bacterium]|nr:hypothetical protein [Oscillospiraceae bacterium]
MKRTILWLCLSSLMLGLLSGCGSQGQAEDNVTVSTISLPGEVSEQSWTTAVETTEEARKQGDVVISFPQLVGDWETANQLLRSDVDTFCEKQLKSGDSGAMTATVIPHQGVISVVTTGTLTRKDNSRTLLVYTTNLDRATGERVSTGVREHAETAAEQILSGKATILESDSTQKQEVTAYLKKLGKDKLTSLLRRCDLTDDDRTPECYSYYIDADSSEVGVYVPVGKKRGDFAIVLVDGAPWMT